MNPENVQIAQHDEVGGVVLGSAGAAAPAAVALATTSVPAATAAVAEPARYRRYHIASVETPGVVEHPSRFRVHVKKHRLVGMVLHELLAGRGPARVPVALSRPCVYGVFGRVVGGLAPIHEKCVGCLRCTTQYPDMVQIHPNPARAQLGDGYLKPDAVDTIHYEATTGRVPVRGAGYRGAFGGEGWDGMWTDMSEIVRPTRDGIHGRETISTAVDVGRRASFLRFDGRGEVVTPTDPVLALPLPFVFDLPPAADAPPSVLRALASAAAGLETLAVLPVADAVRLDLLGPEVAPLVGLAERRMLDRLPASVRLIEIDGWDGALLAEVGRRFPAAVVAVRLPVDAELTAPLERGARVFHLVADYHGRTHGRFVGDVLREQHGRLVAAGIREQVTIIVSGGVAQAEHVPKAIISGADLVGLDTAPAVALQARFSTDCRRREPGVVRYPRFDATWAERRLGNLAAAWRDQLLEVLGAMGLREVRRLRGELGRCMFQTDLEREAFGSLARAGVAAAEPKPSAPAQHAVHWARGVPPLPVLDTAGRTVEQAVVAKHRGALDRGLAVWPQQAFRPPALGDSRWPADLILATWQQASTGRPPGGGLEYRVGRSGGGFDRLDLAFGANDRALPEDAEIDTSIPLNRRPYDRPVTIPVPWYGAGMSYGSVSEQVMLGRAMCARRWRTFTSTGEGGYPESLAQVAEHVITQIATGMFGVREETIGRAPIVEFKYAQGAKPGLGGHLLGDKATMAVAKMRESVPWVSLFSPFPFHSVYSVEDHKKHIDWVKSINPDALVSVKVSTPTDVDMVAVGSYYAGAHIIHIDGSYGGTGAAPEVAKKNIAMPIELAIPKVHRFLESEGIRDQVVLMASGGVRTAWDIAKAIALGADGCILGTAELVAIGCTRCSNCERGRGCPFGLTTTDPELSQLVTPEWAAERLSNLYASFRLQLAEILRRLGLRAVRDLRGRTDLLVYRERES